MDTTETAEAIDQDRRRLSGSPKATQITSDAMPGGQAVPYEKISRLARTIRAECLLNS